MAAGHHLPGGLGGEQLWTTGFRSSVKHVLRRRAAAFYARRYFAEHGRLPEGMHHVSVTVEPEHVNEGADIKNMGNQRSPAYLKTDITFPPAAVYQTGREPPGLAPEPPPRR